MRSVRNLLGFFLVSVAVLAQEGGQKGIELADMNRNVEACTDFFEFSNGAWRAINPIPPSMSRWSRRWQAGEESKDRLKEILDEASAVKNAPKGSVEQLIGDFYGACMDEARVESPRRQAARAAARRDPRDEERRRRPADDHPLPAARDSGAVRRRRRLGQPQPDRRHRADLRRAASACPTATTT